VMELLDTLRALRQTHPNLRMVYTGSIGLHHILGRLKAAGSPSDPTSDMRTTEVPPLALDDATDLAVRLLWGKQVQTDEPQGLARELATAVDCVPYYIHNVVADLPTGKPVGDGAVHQMVTGKLTDGSDPWHFAHYRERMDAYYHERQSLALVLLDVVAGADSPLPLDQITNLARHARSDVDPEAVRDLLKLLRRDHYLQLSEDGAYDFKFSLIKRWWRLDRGLAA